MKKDQTVRLHSFGSICNIHVKYLCWLYPCITIVTSFTSVTWWTFPSSRTAFIACASHVIARTVVSAVIGTSLNAVYTVPSIITLCKLRKWKHDSTTYVIVNVFFCFEIHQDFNTNEFQNSLAYPNVEPNVNLCFVDFL